ncbi:MAG: cupin domain-containing protein [Thermaerobacter sp.]|nr:cupin domain-containing protein [Thermaerobacter sp.]
MLRGELTIEFADETHLLHEGDSIYFDSRLPHRYVNLSKKMTAYSVSVTPPSF